MPDDAPAEDGARTAPGTASGLLSQPDFRRVWLAGALAQTMRWLEVLVVSLFVLQLTGRSEEHTSELQSLMRISYAVFCLKKKKNIKRQTTQSQQSIPV